MTNADVSPAMPRVAHYMNRAHTLLLGVTEPLSLADVTWRDSATSANTIAGTLFHIACGYEKLVCRTILGGETIYDRDGWVDRLPVDVDSEPNDPAFEALSEDEYREIRAYVSSVLGEMEAFVVNLSAEQEAAGPAVEDFGNGSVGELLIWPMLFHTTHHFGEISALIGVRGGKGLPF